VLDIFLGSGTTLLAAEQSGRRCLGVELDPAYVDVTISRWRELTGAEPRHLDLNAWWDEVCHQRGNPAGWPTGTVRLNDVITKELNKVVAITENGQPEEVSRLEAIVMAMVAKSMKGDVRAATTLLKIAGPAEEEAVRLQGERNMKQIEAGINKARAIMARVAAHDRAKPPCPKCDEYERAFRERRHIDTGEPDAPEATDFDEGCITWDPPFDEPSPLSGTPPTPSD
jgi:Family of unknown function (DUF5681)/DNA methylase